MRKAELLGLTAVILMNVMISDPMVDIVTLSYPLYLTISDIIGKVTQMQL